jgi:uroporphyrinogen decarboxylase
MKSNTISPRERFLTALDGREPDRVPIFDAPNNPELFIRYLGDKNYYSTGKNAVDLSKKLGMDACLVPERGYTGLIAPHWDWIKEDEFIDELGVTYRVNESSWPLAVPVKAAITSKEDWKSIRLPNPDEEWRYAEVEAAVNEAHRDREDDIAVIAGIRSAFAVLYISMGLEELSIALYEDPDFVKEMAEALDEFWTSSAIHCIRRGADAVFIANDLGLNTGTIISPALLRSIFFPSLSKQISRIREAGKNNGGKIIYHSCGNIKEVLPDLVEMGIHCYNNVQVGAGMDLAEVKEHYGDAIALMGNVDATEILPRVSPEELEEAVKKTISIGAPGGGYILASDHSFHKGVPLSAVETFIRAGKKWGRYPIEID